MGPLARSVRPPTITFPLVVVVSRAETCSKVFLGSFGINDSDQCLLLLNRLMTYINVRR